MTVTSLAKELGASKPTIYARVKKAGLNWSDLRDNITGELTPDAVFIISDLFKDFSTTDKESDVTPTESNTAPDAAMMARIEGLTTENALLRELIAAKDAQIDQLQAQISQLQAQIDALRLDMNEWRQRVPIALPTPRPGFWERMRMKKALGKSKDE